MPTDSCKLLAEAGLSRGSSLCQKIRQEVEDFRGLYRSPVLSDYLGQN